MAIPKRRHLTVLGVLASFGQFASLAPVVADASAEAADAFEDSVVARALPRRAGEESEVTTVGGSAANEVLVLSGGNTSTEAGEEEEGAVGEEEEEEPLNITQINMAVACMLLGAMTFQMGLFYLLNHPDPDIKETSWQVISTTISIFVAVLIFQGICGILEKFMDSYLPKDAEQSVMLIVDGIFFLICFCVMHYFIAREAYKEDRAIKEPDASATREERMLADALRKEVEEEIEVKMTCWATLLAHITAFAAIHFGARMQHLSIFRWNPFMCLIPVLILGILLFVLFRACECFRNRGSRAGHPGTDVWDKEGEEAETDIAKLSLSFLTVSALRYSISGVLPTAHGTEEPAKKHDFGCVLALLGVAVVFCIITVGLVADMLKKETQKREGSLVLAENGGDGRDCPRVSLEDIHNTNTAGLDTMQMYAFRWYKSTCQITAVAFGWSLLYAVKWQALVLPTVGGLPFKPDSTTQCVALALAVTGGSFALIFVLDAIADSKCSGATTDIAMRALINGLAILIGFAWEQSFAAGLEVIAELSSEFGEWYPIFVELFLAIVVSLVVVPAWRLYIVKKVLQLNRAPKEPESEDEDSSTDGEQSETLMAQPLRGSRRF